MKLKPIPCAMTTFFAPVARIALMTAFTPTKFQEPDVPPSLQRSHRAWSSLAVCAPPFVGVNAVIRAIRATGAKNVVIAQGIGFSFMGFPGGVIDTQGQLAYAVHPFLSSAPEKSDWGLRFGNLAATHPFLITAWGANTNDGWCVDTATDIGKPLAFLNYLKQRNIGLAGWAFDSSGAGSITKDFHTYPGVPSVLGTACGEGGGVGTLVQQYFLGTLPRRPRRSHSHPKRPRHTFRFRNEGWYSTSRVPRYYCWRPHQDSKLHFLADRLGQEHLRVEC